MDEPLKCHLAPCLNPTMANGAQCWFHWQTARGWDDDLGRYVEKGEIIPFEQGDDDTEWDDESEACRVTVQGV